MARANRHLVMSQSAAFELSAAFFWYERRRKGLGHRFLSTAETMFTQIAAAPEAFRRVKDETRRGLLPRFPYGVFFIEDESRVVILAVLHVRVSTERWPGG
jgi:plasmid stabilization system protein ParE